MTMPAQVLATRSEIFRQPIRTIDKAPESGLPAAFAMMGAPLMFGRNEEVFGEGESAEYLYRFKSG
jgi:hypothetical protein